LWLVHCYLLFSLFFLLQMEVMMVDAMVCHQSGNYYDLQIYVNAWLSYEYECEISRGTNLHIWKRVKKKIKWSRDVWSRREREWLFTFSFYVFKIITLSSSFGKNKSDKEQELQYTINSFSAQFLWKGWKTWTKVDTKYRWKSMFDHNH